MEKIGRRNFAKSLGLLGLVGLGVEGYREATKIVYRADEFPSEDLEKQLEKKPVLQLQATYGTPKPKPAYSMNQYYFVGSGDDYVEGTRKDVSVQIVPGPDGKLYVKENGTWRKV
jgi:hypothetical protein